MCFFFLVWEVVGRSAGKRFVDGDFCGRIKLFHVTNLCMWDVIDCLDIE